MSEPIDNVYYRAAQARIAELEAYVRRQGLMLAEATATIATLVFERDAAMRSEGSSDRTT